ncbi:DUF6124 family protein [Pseudomonas parakoreensis]|uniref:DUF6124 family protein n=1 Tax=Pseudomonas parakoreensis TaxID=2892331 RepID=UPI003FD0A161
MASHYVAFFGAQFYMVVMPGSFVSIGHNLASSMLNSPTLVAKACKSQASVTVKFGDLVGTLEGPSRNTALAIAQVVMFGELAGESDAG